MLNKILKLEGVKNLTKVELKAINGGINEQTDDCNCFCYVGIRRVNHSCFSYCSNGSIPGLYPNSTGNCTFPDLF